VIHARSEEWGRLLIDGAMDVVWAETTSTHASPRIERPVSCTLTLRRSSRRRQGEGGFIRLESKLWSPVAAGFKAAGLLRVNLVAFEHTRPRDIQLLGESLLEMDISVVLTAMECDARLEACLLLPKEFGLQVVFDGARARRAERLGGMTYSDRLHLLNRCATSGLRIRVLSPYDPWSPFSMGETAEDLSRAGVEEWFLYSRSARSAREERSAVEEEIARLCEDFPYLGTDYGDYLERELQLRASLDGRVKVRGAGRSGRPLHGTLKQLAQPGWLPGPFLDQHVQSWVDGYSICDTTLVTSVGERVGPLAFLSYNHLDREAVAAVRDRLAGQGIETWFADSLQSGTEWYPALEEAFDKSSVFLFFIGPHGVGDFQRRHEITAADTLVREHGRLLIPVILPGVRPETRLPMLLRSYQALDLRKNRELNLERLVETILLTFAALRKVEVGKPEEVATG
jgi:hypothetical protein